MYNSIYRYQHRIFFIARYACFIRKTCLNLPSYLGMRIDPIEDEDEDEYPIPVKFFGFCNICEVFAF